MMPPERPERGRIEHALDYIFPPICVGCGHIGQWICASCWPHTAWRLTAECSTCSEPWDPAHHVHAASLRATTALCFVSDFDEIARQAVHALKYNGRHAISGLIGSLMARAASAADATAVVPLALHSRRRRERGYDQAAMLARAVARELDLPYQPALQRTRYTSQQATLSADERRRNLQGAFRPRRAMAGARVLLVDDVFTTGATMEAGAQALRDAGAREVIGLVFARVDQPAQ